MRNYIEGKVAYVVYDIMISEFAADHSFGAEEGTVWVD
jgi:hypothetical protein